MLDILRSIIQEVNGARDLAATLSIIVRRVQEAMNTRVCSIYLLDKNLGRYVLMATKGLDPAAVGRASLAPEEGLVGFVAQRAEPLNLDNARSHPRYLYIPETREEEFESFLGVPIIHHGVVLGVLVVQQSEQRTFDSDAEALLFTLAAQLAVAIANAEARGAVVGLSPTGMRTADPSFDGVPGAPGVAIAKAFTVFPPADLSAIPKRPCSDIAAEIVFFNECLDAVRNDIRELKVKIKDRLRPEEHELFDAYLHMLSDNALGNEVVACIKEGSWAQGALAQVGLSYVRNLEQIEDAYLRERATDIKDLCGRVLFYLQQKQPQTMRYPERCILVSEELTAAMLAEVPRERLVGVVSAKGSAHAHVAILARAMGLPAVMGVSDLPFSELDGQELILDGYNGKVYSNPSEALRGRYQEIVREEVELSEGLEAIKELPCVTRDGHRVQLWVNTGLMTDVLRSRERGAEGIGLFRTEVPFLLRERFPTEREQASIYREQLEAFHPKRVTMRTLDIGGDKPLPYFPIKEDNPFLGWRGIRVSMDHPELFLGQVRAMIRASEGLDNLQILLPMVSNVHEIDTSVQLIRRAHQELVEDGHRVMLPPLGVMIEVPSMAWQVDAVTRRVDFVSVGSNDLTQYMLAVDRNNPRVTNLFSTLHPGVLRVLAQIAKDVRGAGKSLSICGEMAGNPAAAMLLLAMGFEILSMNATNLLKVKSVIRDMTLAQAKLMLERALAAESTEEVKALLDQALYEAGVGRLLRASRTS
ncbi:MAG: phosphoenolpyruvate--protein phosphotransferase [Pseudomonadales bacterium]|jgi:phosphotransferase system enzyme I (PtsP)|nr:phosphoenolpyruvate--protein phosphotransferase [Pseudomonadales bacterium]